MFLDSFNYLHYRTDYGASNKGRRNGTAALKGLDGEDQVGLVLAGGVPEPVE